MAKNVNIEEQMPHRVSEVICINCKYRYIAVRPVGISLTSLECPQCRHKGFIIETGEDLDNLEEDNNEYTNTDFS